MMMRSGTNTPECAPPSPDHDLSVKRTKNSYDIAWSRIELRAQIFCHKQKHTRNTRAKGQKGQKGQKEYYLEDGVLYGFETDSAVHNS